MSNYPQGVPPLESLLEGVSKRVIWELCIKVLRRRRTKQPGANVFETHRHLGEMVVSELASAKALRMDRNWATDVFQYAQEHDSALQGVAEFVWWMVRAGLAIPFRLTYEHRQDCGHLGALRLTQSGMAFLDAEDEDHPLLPEWPERVRHRCPGLSDEVIALLEDARACMDVGLLRPAVVLMGLAYETAIDDVVEHLNTLGYLRPQVDKDRTSAKVKRDKVASIIDAVLTGSFPDDVDTARDAHDFADRLRLRRNNAAHTRPRYGFEDREEVEEFLVSAARHLPGLWSLTRGAGSAAAPVPPRAPVVTR
jgi:hypothetical protein